jgi:predicted RNase H-like HicB family nuclease
MTYPIALRKTEEGYSVSCPELPGCCSQGATEKEALENIRSAIQEYLAAREEETFNDPGIRRIEIAL